MDEVKRILLAVKETAGDVFIATGLIPGILRKFPNASLYFATEKKYFEILAGHPQIKRVIEYHPSMLNYRTFETWGPQRNTFDVVYHPSIVTQHMPHWIHGGHGEYLGHVYAHMCDLDRNEYGPQFIRIDEDPSIELPGEYLTVHARTNQQPKDYSYIQSVIDRSKISVVQIGGRDDPPLNNVSLDLRGKTTPQTLAWVLSKSRAHAGLDSFPMHVALHVNTPCAIAFGGTYAKQGVWPAKAHLVRALEPENRWMCHTSCHLIECEMQKRGLGKCIDNIPSEKMASALADLIGPDKVAPAEPLFISAYMILKDGVKYGFPFRLAVEMAARVADEVVVVDGGSTDGTLESLEILKRAVPKLKVFKTKWDMDNPTLFGDEKTRARRHCSGNYLLQLDADELVHEPRPGAFRALVELHRDADVIDLPVINFYGDGSTVRLERASWKWRVSKNDPNIVHGVHREARLMDSGRITMDKRLSDSCEMIYADTLQITRHKIAFPLDYEKSHQEALSDESKRVLHAERLARLVAEDCVVFHYSWADLARKEANGEFWNGTWHGKRKATHNTTEDIRGRVKAAKDVLVKVNFDHPLKDIGN